jgi:hypothetical protein
MIVHRGAYSRIVKPAQSRSPAGTDSYVILEPGAKKLFIADIPSGAPHADEWPSEEI